MKNRSCYFVGAIDWAVGSFGLYYLDFWCRLFPAIVSLLGIVLIMQSNQKQWVKWLTVMLLPVFVILVSFLLIFGVFIELP